MKLILSVRGRRVTQHVHWAPRRPPSSHLPPPTPHPPQPLSARWGVCTSCLFKSSTERSKTDGTGGEGMDSQLVYSLRMSSCGPAFPERGNNGTKTTAWWRWMPIIASADCTSASVLTFEARVIFKNCPAWTQFPVISCYSLLSSVIGWLPPCYSFPETRVWLVAHVGDTCAAAITAARLQTNMFFFLSFFAFLFEGNLFCLRRLPSMTFLHSCGVRPGENACYDSHFIWARGLCLCSAALMSLPFFGFSVLHRDGCGQFQLVRNSAMVAPKVRTILPLKL